MMYLEQAQNPRPVGLLERQIIISDLRVPDQSTVIEVPLYDKFRRVAPDYRAIFNFNTNLGNIGGRFDTLKFEEGLELIKTITAGSQLRRDKCELEDYSQITGIKFTTMDEIAQFLQDNPGMTLREKRV